MLNSCIEVSDYNEPYSLCQTLLPSPLSTLGLTRSTQRHTTPLHTRRLRTWRSRMHSGWTSWHFRHMPTEPYVRTNSGNIYIHRAAQQSVGHTNRAVSSRASSLGSDFGLRVASLSVPAFLGIMTVFPRPRPQVRPSPLHTSKQPHNTHTTANMPRKSSFPRKMNHCDGMYDPAFHASR